MKEKRSKAYYETLFTIGLCLAIFVMIDLRQALLPDFISGVLGGISISLLLGAGIRKRKVSYTTDRN